MMDRDSLMELLDIVSQEAESKQLPLTGGALPVIRENVGKGGDVFLRRRLSVCRMLIGLHLPVTTHVLDVLLAATLCHWLPGDAVPADYLDRLGDLYAGQPEIAGILAVLCYEGEDYYGHLMAHWDALLIRLTERGVLVESLYEWPPADARRYLRETREHFFEMCIYAKEHYGEFLGPVSILMEKTRNLTIANEALLRRYEEIDDSLQSEILSLREENAALRAMIREISAAEDGTLRRG